MQGDAAGFELVSDSFDNQSTRKMPKKLCIKLLSGGLIATTITVTIAATLITAIETATVVTEIETATVVTEIEIATVVTEIETTTKRVAKSTNEKLF